MKKILTLMAAIVALTGYGQITLSNGTLVGLTGQVVQGTNVLGSGSSAGQVLVSTGAGSAGWSNDISGNAATATTATNTTYGGVIAGLSGTNVWTSINTFSNVIIAQSNANAGLVVSNGANYVVITNGGLLASGNIKTMGSIYLNQSKIYTYGLNTLSSVGYASAGPFGSAPTMMFSADSQSDANRTWCFYDSTPGLLKYRAWIRELNGDSWFQGNMGVGGTITATNGYINPVQALTYTGGTNVLIPVTAGQVFTLLLTTNTFLSFTTNANSYQDKTFTLKTRQDTNGTWAVTWNTNIYSPYAKFSGGVAPSATTNSSAEDVWTFQPDFYGLNYNIVLTPNLR